MSILIKDRKVKWKVRESMHINHNQKLLFNLQLDSNRFKKKLQYNKWREQTLWVHHQWINWIVLNNQIYVNSQDRNWVVKKHKIRLNIHLLRDHCFINTKYFRSKKRINPCILVYINLDQLRLKALKLAIICNFKINKDNIYKCLENQQTWLKSKLNLHLDHPISRIIN